MNYSGSLHSRQDYMILPSEESQQNARSSNITCKPKKTIGVLFRASLTPVALLRDTQALTNLLCLETFMNKTSMTPPTVSRISLASLLYPD